jgi:hypothetical protein
MSGDRAENTGPLKRTGLVVDAHIRKNRDRGGGGGGVKKI